MNKIPITINGEKRLREELDELTRVKRPKIIEAISKAREHGDLKENAEYHAARESQSFIEGRIQDIESKLSNAEVIDPLKINTKDVIVFTISLFIKPPKTISIISIDFSSVILMPLAKFDSIPCFSKCLVICGPPP